MDKRSSIKEQINKNQIMRLKYLFLYALTTVLISGCSNKIFKKNEIEIEFIYRSSLVKSSIKLKNDGTFCYRHNAESSETITKGYWILKDNNEIILNSYNDYLTDTIIVKELDKVKSDTATVRVYDFYYNKPTDYATLKFNDSDSILQLDDNGEIKFKKPKDFKLLNISTFRKSYTYQIKDTNCTTFDINLYEKNEYEYFKNKKLQIKNKKIYRNNTLIYKKE